MPLFNYHHPVACYQTKDITRYSRTLFSQATGLFQLVHELMPSGFAEEHCIIWEGSFSIIATSTDQTVAKIVIYQRGVGQWIIEDGCDWSNGVYIWVRANRESGQEFELATQDPHFQHSWVINRFVPDYAVSVAPNLDEHFYYFRLEPDEDLRQIAELLVFCSTL